jgi:hypothetical protein
VGCVDGDTVVDDQLMLFDIKITSDANKLDLRAAIISPKAEKQYTTISLRWIILGLF